MVSSLRLLSLVWRWRAGRAIKAMTRISPAIASTNDTSIIVKPCLW